MMLTACPLALQRVTLRAAQQPKQTALARPCSKRTPSRAVRSGAVAMADDGTRKLTADEQDRLNAGIGSVGLSDEGPLCGGQWISSTTRHVHIFAGEVVNGDLDQSKLDKLTIDVDPDCEFIWTDDALNKVFQKFDALVAEHKGAPLNDYTLRLIGSDTEHFIRKLLQKGEISYDLEHRALNYSMGRPRMPLADVPEEAATLAANSGAAPAAAAGEAVLEADKEKAEA